MSDENELAEFSVVYTNRSLNHMSHTFQKTMKEISRRLKSVYNADGCALIPGGGTYAMEAVARQYATDKFCLVIRNGLFSYRWTQIFDTGRIPRDHIAIKARKQNNGPTDPFYPPPLDEVLELITSQKPDLVFAPHVETSAGLVLPHDYVQRIALAVHEYGGLLVLDCIASGCAWVDMQDVGVDVLITAPQKGLIISHPRAHGTPVGWNSSPGCGVVMFSSRALSQLETTTSTSFACDLKKWYLIMKSYEDGGHAYHATMPTDAIATFLNSIREIETIGFEDISRRQQELGAKVRKLLESRGYPSVSADGYQSSGVVVSYTADPAMKSGILFAQQGIQISAGVPLFCDEGNDFSTFRIGLFGVDKLSSIDETVAQLEVVLDFLKQTK